MTFQITKGSANALMNVRVTVKHLSEVEGGILQSCYLPEVCSGPRVFFSAVTVELMFFRIVIYFYECVC